MLAAYSRYLAKVTWAGQVSVEFMKVSRAMRTSENMANPHTCIGMWMTGEPQTSVTYLMSKPEPPPKHQGYHHI